MNVNITNHPLIQHKLSMMRSVDTGCKEFRELASEIAGLLCYEVTRDLEMKTAEITTPITTATLPVLANEKFAVVPILRAGLGMVDGVLNLIPNIKVGHIGLYRDPNTLEPVEYYCKLPTDIEERHVFLVDPMLTTGGSASAAISLLKNKGVKNIRCVNILAAPEGVRRINEDHPDIPVYCAALDECLNDHGYIVPGLGDAGDRIFGTK
ncbi:MAG: uracil phosphoribosyltransferase [Clostridia bacterium]|nr:uracil phosphoribosyltransferase [Clostridia bacterium]